jgi:hypothetical protein
MEIKEYTSVQLENILVNGKMDKLMVKANFISIKLELLILEIFIIISLLMVLSRMLIKISIVEELKME